MAPTWSPDGRRIAFWGLRDETFQRDLWSVAADGSAERERGRGLARRRSGDRLGAGLLARRTVALLRLDPRRHVQPLASGARRRHRPAAGRARAAHRAVELGRSVRPLRRRPPDRLRRPQRPDRDRARRLRPRAPGRSPPRRRRSSAARSRSASSSCRSTASRIVFTNEDMPQHLHLVHADGTGYRQLTTGDERNRQGSWSPQGRLDRLPDQPGRIEPGRDSPRRRRPAADRGRTRLHQPALVARRQARC